MAIRVVARIRPQQSHELEKDVIVSTASNHRNEPTFVKVPNPKNEGEVRLFGPMTNSSSKGEFSKHLLQTPINSKTCLMSQPSSKFGQADLNRTLLFNLAVCTIILRLSNDFLTMKVSW